jgi:hypothetical protein
MLRALLRWLLRALPVLAVSAIAGAHYLVLKLGIGSASTVNKLFGTGLQVVGGLLVLHSIDQNLGLFKEKTLSSYIVDWAKSNPFRRSKPTIVQLKGSSTTAFGGTATITTSRAPTTIEERLTALEEKVRGIQAQAERMNAELSERVQLVRTELGASIATTQQTLSDLRRKLDESAVGGFKQQIFGVLLAIYGALVSAFT